MKNYLILMIAAACLSLSACGEYKGTLVEYANTCDKANDGKYIEVVGFFNNTGSAMCSKRGNEPMLCPINFVDTPSQPKPVRTEIYLGSGANYVENIEGKGLKIRDDKGEIIENSQKVKIIGSLMTYDSPSKPTDNYAPCSITIYKIEKAP